MVVHVSETPSSRLSPSVWSVGLSRPHRYPESLAGRHCNQTLDRRFKQCPTLGRKCVVSASAESPVVSQEALSPHTLELKFGDRYVRLCIFILICSESWLLLRRWSEFLGSWTCMLPFRWYVPCNLGRYSFFLSCVDHIRDWWNWSSSFWCGCRDGWGDGGVHNCLLRPWLCKWWEFCPSSNQLHGEI